MANNMDTKVLLKRLSKMFPKRLAASYDHVGLQLGKIKDDTKTIFLCLDFDEIVLKYILDNHLEDKIDLIITHHPFFFGKRSQILKHDEHKRMVTDKMLELDIPIYSYHTNFDTGYPGMNDALTELLGLQNIKVLDTDNCARGGELTNEMEVHEFCKYAIEKLRVPYGSLIAKGNKYIKKVAIVGGGGWSSYRAAQFEGYDIFISGDITHHSRRDIVLDKFNYLNIPHEVENVFMEQFKKVLLSIEPNLEVLTLTHEEIPELIS